MTPSATPSEGEAMLLPCPFCGGAAELNIFYEDDTVNVVHPICDVEFAVVHCTSCGFSKQRAAVIDATGWWNTRAAAQSSSGVREALEAFVDAYEMQDECNFTIELNTAHKQACRALTPREGER